MNEDSIIQYITGTFEGVETETLPGGTFFFYGDYRMLPFATLVTNDDFDQASNLSRPSVFRLNIGIRKQTFRSLFGQQTSRKSQLSGQPQPSLSGTGDVAERGYDFTALDQLMPHPEYGNMNWVCVLNPSDATFQEVVQPLLAEAYDLAVSNQSNRAARA